MANNDGPVPMNIDDPENVGGQQQVPPANPPNPIPNVEAVLPDLLATITAVLAQNQEIIGALTNANGANPNPPAPKAVRIVDIKMEQFSGGPKDSSIMHPEQLVEFDKWYHLSLHRMRTAGLPEDQFGACLIHNLDGPARATWFARYPNTYGITQMQFYAHFCALIPHYRLFCTNKYTSAVFTKSNFIDDVDKFLAYVRFSGVMADLTQHHEVICDMFYQKLSLSFPRLIEVARTRYAVELKASDSLWNLASYAKQVARRYFLDFPESTSLDRPYGKRSYADGNAMGKGGGGKESWKEVLTKKQKRMGDMGSTMAAPRAAPRVLRASNLWPNCPSASSWPASPAATSALICRTGTTRRASLLSMSVILARRTSASALCVTCFPTIRILTISHRTKSLSTPNEGTPAPEICVPAKLSIFVSLLRLLGIFWTVMCRLMR